MRRHLVLLGLLGLYLPLAAQAAPGSGVELFARGSVSKNFLRTDSYILSISAATGIAFTLIPRIRLEGRYTNASSLQNKLSISLGGIDGALHDVMTQTAIYSVGVDFDLLGPQSSFQPFLYVGAGYITTERSYYVLADGAPNSIYLKEPTQTGISGNLGLGFRLRVASAFAFEVEAFAYAVDVDKPNPLVNVLGSIGIRLFL